MEKALAVGFGNPFIEKHEGAHVKHHLNGGETEQLEVDPEVGAEIEGDIQIQQANKDEIEHEGEIEKGPVAARHRHHAAKGAFHQALAETLQQVAVAQELANQQGRGKHEADDRRPPFDEYIVMQRQGHAAEGEGDGEHHQVQSVPAFPDQPSSQHLKSGGGDNAGGGEHDIPATKKIEAEKNHHREVVEQLLHGHFPYRDRRWYREEGAKPTSSPGPGLVKKGGAGVRNAARDTASTSYPAPFRATVRPITITQSPVMFRCPDFHSHSLASDVMLSPAALVARAAEYGVDALALTDHDTLAGLPEAARAAREHGLSLVPGIELSVLWGSRDIHVVGLWVDADSPVLTARVEAQQAARRERAIRMGERLDRAARITGSYPKACALANTDAPGRPWFARMLVEEGVVRDQGHAFNRFLKKGQSGFVATPWVSLEQGVADLLAAGGVPVLAHPQAYQLSRKRLRELVRDFRAAGGLAIEALLPGLSPAQAALLEECWRHFDLAVSGGSDFHSPEQKWLRLGGLPPFPADATPVWAVGAGALARTEAHVQNSAP